MTKAPDDFFASMIKSVQDRRGASGAFMASDFAKYQQGIKIPHLMMEYIFGLNVIPMPSLIEFAGLPGSCKSAFLQYVMSVFTNQDMLGMYVETENKASHTLLESFLGEEGGKKVFFLPGPMTMEGWEGEILNALKNYRKAYAAAVKAWEKKPTEPFPVKPLCLGLDSLTGGASEEAMEATDKEGKTGRAYPVEALILSKFFPQIPTRMRDLPMVFIYTNHEQSRMEEKKGPFTVAGPRRSQGGQRPDYYCGIRMFFEQEAKPQHIAGGVVTQTVGIEVGKNSFNESRQRISLPMYWKTDIAEDNTPKQRTWFGWEWALADFLAPTTPGYKYDREAVKKFLTVIRDTSTAFSCKELGLSRVTGDEIGKAIEADHELVDKLRPYLGIKSWKIWNGKPINTDVEEEQDIPDPEPVTIPEETSEE